MHYCVEEEEEVYGCDHHRCNNREGKYGTAIQGMKWCAVSDCHVYSCDHYDCNK